MSTNIDQAPAATEGTTAGDGLTGSAREALALLAASIDEHEQGFPAIAERLGIPGAGAVFDASVGMMRVQLSIAERELRANPESFRAFSAGLSLGRLDDALGAARRNLEAATR